MLHRAGNEVSVFERGSRVGGLCTQTPIPARRVMCALTPYEFFFSPNPN